MDKLTVALIEKYLAEDTASLHDTNILRQLLDTMRENERLRETLGIIWRGMWSENPTLKEARNMADKALHQNKEQYDG